MAFLFHVWVDVQIERGADIGMSEQYTYGFVVALTFDAAGGEAMP